MITFGPYGHPFDRFSRIGQMWSGILGVPVSPENVGHCMIAFEVIHESCQPSQQNRDNIDAYVYYLEAIATRRQEQREYQQWANGLSPIPVEPATPTSDSPESELVDDMSSKSEQAADELIDQALEIYRAVMSAHNAEKRSALEAMIRHFVGKQADSSTQDARYDAEDRY